MNGSKHEKHMFSSTYWKLFSSRVLSGSSGSMFSLLIIWIAFSATGSGIIIAIIGISELLGPAVFSIFFGNYVDSFDRRKIMILSQVFRTFIQFSIFVFIFQFGFNITFIAVALFVYSSLGTLYRTSENSYLPDIVDGKSLQYANGLLRTSMNISYIISTSAAGLVIVFIGATRGLLITSPEILISAILILRLQKVPVRQRARGKILSEIHDGLVWLIGMRGLFFLTISAMFINFFFTLSTPFYVVFNNRLLGGSPIIFASMLVFYSIGDIIGAIASGKLQSIRYIGAAWTMLYGFSSGVLILVMTIFHLLVIVLAFNFLIGSCVGFGGTTWLTYSQRVVPSEMRGRYFGIDSLGSYAIMPLGEAVGGTIISIYGVYISFLVSAAGLMISSIGFFALKPLRNLGRDSYLLNETPVEDEIPQT